MSPFSDVLRGIQQIANWLWPIAISMAAVGTLTMALLQTAKDIGGWRRKFQQRFVTDWLKEKAKRFAERAQGFKRPGTYLKEGVRFEEETARLLEQDPYAADATKAKNDLVQLATAGDERAFFDLPIEQLAGQMNAAVQAALDYPKEHRDLLWCLAYLASPGDIAALLAPPRALLEKDRRELAPEERDAVDQFVGARNRIAHQIQRAIDGLQIAAGSKWKLRLQSWSIGLSAILGVAALWAATRKAEGVPSLGMFVVTGILAGFLAPVARDLVAALQSLRK